METIPLDSILQEYGLGALVTVLSLLILVLGGLTLVYRERNSAKETKGENETIKSLMGLQQQMMGLYQTNVEQQAQMTLAIRAQTLQNEAYQKTQQQHLESLQSLVTMMGRSNTTIAKTESLIVSQVETEEAHHKEHIQHLVQIQKTLSSLETEIKSLPKSINQPVLDRLESFVSEMKQTSVTPPVAPS